MADEVSKTAADKLGFSSDVIEAIRAQGPSLVGAVEKALFGGGPARPVSVGELFGLMQAELERRSAKYRSADQAHLGELGDDSAPRSRRDAAERVLRGTLIAASEIVRGNFGPEYSRLVGLEAPLAERPDLLVSQARHVVSQIGKHAPTGTPRVRGVNVADVASGVEADAAPLATALTEVTREEREAQATLSARTEAEAEWSRGYGAVGALFAAFATLAGKDDLADRVMPTERRRAGVPEQPKPPQPA